MAGRTPDEAGAATAPAGWSLWRRDDHGHEFEVARGLPHDEAERRAAELAARGHKQDYWVAPTRSTRD
jgi:hypothetical protein